MALNDLKNQNIQDTYQKVVQTDGTNLADGTGSLLPISFDGNNVIISGSLTANEYNISSSVVDVQVATLSGSTNFGNSSDDTHNFVGTSTLGGTVYISGSVYSGSNNEEREGEALVALVITGSIIPEGDGKWSLGSKTNFFKDIYVGHESIKFISSSNEITHLKQEDVKALREGKPIKQDTAVGGTDRIVRAQSIFHETSNEHYIKQTVAGIWDFVGPGGNILTIDARDSNHTVNLNSATSKLNLAGTLSASKTDASHIIGGTTSFGSNTVTINGSSGNISASGNLTVNNINGTINGGNF